jgi:hypothetical protein
MTGPGKICEYCRNPHPVTQENGVIVRYKSAGNVDITVMLHKSCAAAWSKRCTQDVPVQFVAVE